MWTTVGIKWSLVRYVGSTLGSSGRCCNQQSSDDPSLPQGLAKKSGNAISWKML